MKPPTPGDLLPNSRNEAMKEILRKSSDGKPAGTPRIRRILRAIARGVRHA